ncbi:hypothetical protein [Schleiferilactobacillus shenzhenensis]|uniref:Uncharacterized protein n=1 Tax=Schleiferilactobacillus shenzhenensis LY-73 TaxID=1231336 RepID=U4TNX6_9LACO|nr:hypothetical protein [Schleiferilactobacillus shenzhenensis]ERL65150.1 hypothetical protein L248_3088 [Schleiferilactobacillus shenzhenensis LY-73]
MSKTFTAAEAKKIQEEAPVPVGMRDEPYIVIKPMTEEEITVHIMEMMHLSRPDANEWIRKTRSEIKKNKNSTLDRP